MVKFQKISIVSEKFSISATYAKILFENSRDVYSMGTKLYRKVVLVSVILFRLTSF